MPNLFNYFIKHSFSCFCLFFVGIILIFSPSLDQFGFDEKRIIELLLLSLVLFGFIISSENNPFFNLTKKKQLSLISLLIFLTLSSVNAESQNNAFLESSLYIGLLFFCLYISKLYIKNDKIISLFFFISLSFSALLYQTNFFSAFTASFIANIPLQWPEPFSGFSNIRFFNQYQVWSIFLLPLPILLYPSLDNRLLNTLKILSVGWAVLLFASNSRGAIVSITFAMILTFIIFKGHSKPFLKLNSTLLLAGAITYLLLFKLFPVLFDNEITKDWEQLANVNNRITLWKIAIQHITNNPWFGIGPMHYAYYPGAKHAHPHNSILQWACEMGIPSVLLVIFLVTSGLTAWVKKFYRLNNEIKQMVSTHLWVSLFCSICSGLIYSLVSGVIVMPLSQIMMALIAGWMMGIYFKDYTEKPISNRQHISFRLISAITLITLSYTVLPGLLPRITSPPIDLPYQDYPVIAPRFWQLGGIVD